MGEKINKIKEMCKDACFEYFGLRGDNAEYQTGDACEASHQIFQDPQYTDDTCEELIFPYVSDPESPYYGFYDAGELDGTCSIGFDPEDENSIRAALYAVEMYGKKLYIIGGNRMEHGHDDGEYIIKEAEIVGRL